MVSAVSANGHAVVVAIAFLLGVKHGFDADHLAAIDGLTRRNAWRKPRLARGAGALFSLGHGAVVISVALAVSRTADTWQLPSWLDALGAWTSIAVLSGLAAVNISAVVRAGTDRPVVPIGWRAGVWRRLLGVGHPLSVVAVGALFALSFDTVSQAALFAVAAREFGGFGMAASLAGLFVVGMLVADGANGLWISRLIRRSDRAACVASRVMTLAVSGVGLLTAGLGVALQTSERAQAWAAGKELWFGLAVVTVVGISYLVGRRLGRTQQPGAARAPG